MTYDLFIGTVLTVCKIQIQDSDNSMKLCTKSKIIDNLLTFNSKEKNNAACHLAKKSNNNNNNCVVLIIMNRPPSFRVPKITLIHTCNLSCRDYYMIANHFNDHIFLHMSIVSA